MEREQAGSSGVGVGGGMRNKGKGLMDTDNSVVIAGRGGSGGQRATENHTKQLTMCTGGIGPTS